MPVSDIDLLKRELDHLRDEFRSALAAQVRIADERDAARTEAIRVAAIANDSRLDKMNEFRSALNDQTSRLVTRAEVESGRNALAGKTEEAIGALAAKLDAEIKPLHVRLEMLSRPNWTLMMSILSVALVLIGGTYTIVGLAISSAIQPNATAIVALVEHNHQQDTILAGVEIASTASTAADLVSRGDRQELNGRLHTLEAAVSTGSADRRAVTGAIQEKLLEIETQFCAGDIVRNLFHANDLRVMAMMWTKTMGGTLPTDNAYYPTMCNNKR